MQVFFSNPLFIYILFLFFLWQFFNKGYFVSTVGQYTNEEVIKKYVSNQGKASEYKKIHKSEQLSIFENIEPNED